jgi:hypothetical protein
LPENPFQTYFQFRLENYKKNSGNRKLFPFFLNRSGVGEEMISGFKADLVFSSRSFSDNQLSIENFQGLAKKKSNPDFQINVKTKSCSGFPVNRFPFRFRKKFRNPDLNLSVLVFNFRQSYFKEQFFQVGQKASLSGFSNKT